MSGDDIAECVPDLNQRVVGALELHRARTGCKSDTVVGRRRRKRVEFFQFRCALCMADLNLSWPASSPMA